MNDGVHWYPEHIKHGRFGNWLENNVDWALSRERYWGTPLPIWRCAEGHETAIGSLTELSDLSGRDVHDVDPHRPFLDEITFPCPTCAGVATRVPEVIDAWYDSGAMPFAQWGYHPELGRGIEAFEAGFPADFISEAIDQTRGWFYTLMAEGVLHFDETAYRNVVCLGHLIAEDGRKMSKSLGNQFDPWQALEPPGSRRPALVDAHERLPVGAAPDRPRDPRRARAPVPAAAVEHLRLLCHVRERGGDRSRCRAAGRRGARRCWIGGSCPSSRGAVRDVRAGLDAYDATGAGRRIQRLIDDLSNVVRRDGAVVGSGTRAGRSTPTPAPRSARCTLCLVTLAQLLAPFTPFVSEALWRNLAAARDGRPDSVHLSDFPVVDEAALDPGSRRRDGDGAAAGRARPARPCRHEGAHPPTACRGGRARARARLDARGACS